MTLTPKEQVEVLEQPLPDITYTIMMYEMGTKGIEWEDYEHAVMKLKDIDKKVKDIMKKHPEEFI